VVATPITGRLVEPPIASNAMFRGGRGYRPTTLFLAGVLQTPSDSSQSLLYCNCMITVHFILYNSKYLMYIVFNYIQ
jgi:hypothetical protein